MMLNLFRRTGFPVFRISELVLVRISQLEIVTSQRVAWYNYKIRRKWH
jgi:hypothetical protein